jgi:putative tricarboxylic transport membrane protein
MDAIIIGFQTVFSDPITLLLMLAGVFMGVVFGSIPGLTATLGVALVIPFTFTMTAVQGLSLLLGIYVGGISGGLITATLINIPGTPSSIVTCWDGYPMAKKLPGEALSIGVFASLVGGLFSSMVLFSIAPQLAKVSLIFGQWEYFAVAVMGMAIVVAMVSDDIVRGLIGAVIGVLLAAVGMDNITGVSRMTFGNWQLTGGISMTALMMGLFAIREIMDQTIDLHNVKEKMTSGRISLMPPWKYLKGTGKSLGIGSVFGSLIGILPGIGQNAATILAYNQARKVSKHPEKFGHGSPEGICASESSNNAVNGGALIPLVTLGIPGPGDCRTDRWPHDPRTATGTLVVHPEPGYLGFDHGALFHSEYRDVYHDVGADEAVCADNQREVVVAVSGPYRILCHRCLHIEQ